MSGPDRPVAGGEALGARALPEMIRFELNSATKVEFCLLKWTAVNMAATVSKYCRS